MVAVGLLAFAVFSILGREAAGGRLVDTLPLTALPLGFGGGLLLLLAFSLEGVPTLPLAGWPIVLWLAVINTAFAQLFYNHSLRVLTQRLCNQSPKCSKQAKIRTFTTEQL